MDREGKKALASVLKQITRECGARCPHCLTEAGTTSGCLQCSPERGLPLQRTSYKRNRNKGTKKEKGKKEKQLV